MLSSKLVRHRNSHHTPKHTNKIASTHTHTVSIQTHLQHLIGECVTDFKKISIDRQLKSHIETLDEKYRNKIHDEIKNEFDALTDIFSPDDSLASKIRAQGWELICALRSTRRFLDNYAVTCTRMSLSAAINPRHLHELSESFRESFSSLNQEDRILLASVITPSVFNELGICLNACEKSISNQTYRKDQQQLNFDQVVSLLDYAHYATGTFNGINCGMRVFEYSRIQTIADVIFCVQQPLSEALTLLLQKNEFVYRGNLIKGIRINDPGGPLRRAKLRTGNLVVFPHPTSTTSDPTRSYAQRGTHDGELVFLNGSGVKIHLFHNILTMKESEVLMPIKGSYRMVDSNKENPKKNGSIERFYCEPVLTDDLEPDPQSYA